MSSPVRTSRRLIALVLAASVIGVSAAVPLLDAGADPGPVLSAEDSGQRYADHDHRICQLHGAGAWSLAGETTPPAACLVRDSRIPVDARLRPELLLLSTNQPRAPPST